VDDRPYDDDVVTRHCCRLRNTQPVLTDRPITMPFPYFVIIIIIIIIVVVVIYFSEHGITV